MYTKIVKIAATGKVFADKNFTKMRLWLLRCSSDLLIPLRILTSLLYVIRRIDSRRLDPQSGTNYKHSSRIRFFRFFFKIQKRDFLRFFEVTCQKT